MPEKIWTARDLVEFAASFAGDDNIRKMEEVGIMKDEMHEFVGYCAIQLVIRGHSPADTLLSIGAAMFHLGYEFHRELNKENVSV